MNLHEAIYQVLFEADRPMTAKELADVINVRGLYLRKDKSPVASSQITGRVLRYPEEFDYIQGEIILTQNSSWTDILRSYKYLHDMLRDLSRGDKGALVVFLIFYKRISDLSEFRGEHRMPEYGRISFLRNKVVHFSSTYFANEFKAGIQYLEKEFPQLHDFFAQQFDLIKRLDDRIIYEIFIALSYFDTSKLEDRKFGRIFEYLIQKSFSPGKGDYYFTPQPVAELFGNLIDTNNVFQVYDPCAGLGGLLTELNKQIDHKNTYYFASEHNSRVAALGTLNLILNGIQNFEYHNADCLANSFDTKFDLIVSDLPLISKINDNADLSFVHELGLPLPPKKGATAALLLFVLSKLKQGGKAFVTVPEGFLFRKGYDEVARKFIIDNGLLDAVISLPANTLNPYTSVKISILCLSSISTSHVKFIKGATNATSSDDLSRSWNVDDIISAYKWADSDTRVSTVIPHPVIRRNDYVLSVDQYNEIFKETEILLDEGTGLHLESLAHIQSGTTLRTAFDLVDEDVKVLWDESKIHVIKAENLKKDIFDLKIGKEDLTSLVSFDSTVERSVLREKCLLIARIGDNPKPTIFDPQDFDRPVAIHRGVFALVPNDVSNISVEYLYYQFYSPFVQQQLANSQVGSTIPHSSISNLKKVVIPIVDTSEQKKFVSAQRANLIQIEREKIDKRLKLLGYEKEVADKESDIVRVLVHQLRPTFMSLNSQVEVILRIVEKNQLEHFKEFNFEAPDFSDPELTAIGITPNKPANHTLEEICNKLLKDSRDINDKLTYVNKVMSFNLSKDHFQETEIKGFLENHVRLLQVNNPLKFAVEVTGEKCTVEFNRESIGELIDLLINNAKEHAFNESSTHNIVKINIRPNKQTPVVAIEYSNNGNDFKLSFDQFVSPFEKGKNSHGSGIGGYYIKRIVEAHGGSLLPNEKQKRGFSLIIELPITQKSVTDE